MGFEFYSDNSKESISVYYDFFLVVNKYVELTYHGDKKRLEAAQMAAKEVMDKLMKLAEQKKSVRNTFNETAGLLAEQTKKGVEAVSTHKLAADVENFLTQGKGVLDLLANKLFKELVGYVGKFNHKNIIKHLREQLDLDQSVVNEIEVLLNRDWDIWLKSFVDDRNLHHEENIKISKMSYMNGQPIVFFERRDGNKFGNLDEFVNTHWNNLMGLISDLIWLVFASKLQIFKTVRVTRDMFISPDSPDYEKPNS
jgi:hypothetical protein